MSTQRIPLMLSPEHPCSYLKGEWATNAFVDPRMRMSAQTYATLLQNGFRRSGPYTYRPMCSECQACQSARIPIEAFRFHRWQRRVWKRNGDLTASTRPALFSPEHFALYQRYLRGRHDDGEMDPNDRNAYLNFLTSAWMETRFVEFRLHGALVAVAATDILPDALSAVYTFYEPALEQRSLGTYAILWQICEARRRGLSHLYLGYWVPDSPKMHYKIRFTPIELYRDGNWQRFDSSDVAIERRGQKPDN